MKYDDVTDAELFEAMDLDRPGLANVRAASATGDFQAAYEEWGQYLATRREPRSYVDIETYGEGMQQAFPRIAEVIVRMADQVVAKDVTHGDFRLTYEDGIPNFVVDPHGTLAGFGMLSMYLAEPLGRAWLITGEARYVESYRLHLRALYDQRQRIPKWQGKLDLFWTSELETGLRLIHILDAYLCVRGYPGLTPADHEAALKFILAFSDFELQLARRGEHSCIVNQQVAGAAGLGLSGALMPEFRNSAEKKALGSANISTFLARGVYADGAAQELCTQYHFTMIRDPAKLGRTLMLSGESSAYTGGENAELFRRMHDWAACLVAPDGFVPPHHSGVYCTEWLPYLMIYEHFNPGAGYARLIDQYYSPDFVPVSKQRPGDTLFLLTPEMTPEKIAPAPDPGPADVCSGVNLQPSGTCVMRVGKHGETAYLSTVYGKPVEGHGYPQLGSFVLHTAGEWRALHPGSPRSYSDPEYRSYFHTTFSHNTVIVDNANQSFFAGDPDHPELGATCTAWADDPHATVLRIVHEGYLKVAGIMHTRTFVMLDRGWLFIHDRLRRAGRDNREHAFSWAFHTGMDMADRGAGMLRAGDFALVPAYPQEITTSSAVRSSMLPIQFDEDLETQQGKLNQYTLDKKGKQISFGVALATLSPGEQPPRVTMLSRVDHRDEFEAFQVSAPDVDYIIMVQNDPAQSSAMQLPDLNLATTSPVLVAAVGNDEVMWQVEALSGETAGAS